MSAVCAIGDCESPIFARGWCGKHYQRWHKYGDPTVTTRWDFKKCAIDGCEQRAKGRGWCNMHYQRWYKQGDPERNKRLARNDKTRFWAKVRLPDENGCLNWTGATFNGYGQFQFRGKVVRAHRFAYELLVGPIPKGLTLDHLCRNRACVNPDHLEPVTDRVNILRGTGPSARQARQTHCIHGHEFAGDNLYVCPKGKRYCRQCHRDKLQRHREIRGVS